MKKINVQNQWPILALVIAIIGITFYWYEVRPSRIKKECAELIAEAGSKVRGASASDYRVIYDMCLHQKGL